VTAAICASAPGLGRQSEYSEPAMRWPRRLSHTNTGSPTRTARPRTQPARSQRDRSQRAACKLRPINRASCGSESAYCSPHDPKQLEVAPAAPRRARVGAPPPRRLRRMLGPLDLLPHYLQGRSSGRTGLRPWQTSAVAGRRRRRLVAVAPPRGAEVFGLKTHLPIERPITPKAAPPERAGRPRPGLRRAPTRPNRRNGGSLSGRTLARDHSARERP
jgi:hypothetical protein